MSKVLLGFVDEHIKSESCSDDAYTVNKIGGLSNTLNQNFSPKCPLCNRQTPLLIQIYAPVTNSIYHRTLYIHACVSPGCWNKSQSWICLRRQWVAVDDYDNKQQSTTFIEWCDDADDWGEEPVAVAEDNGNITVPSQAIELCDTASAELENSDADDNVVAEPIEIPNTNFFQLLDSRKEIPSDHYNMTIFFEPYYISVAYEESSDTVKEHANNLLHSYQNNQTILEEKNEGYEKSLPAHGDKLFETFASMIRKNPGQILRYCRTGGKPLFLYEESEPNECTNCQGKLLFELQILPSLITYLKLICGDDHLGSGHLEFGTALIYTCENNCWNEGDTYKYECVIVQEEKLF
ncbi:programmed cell death protein 2-like [Metopolophium dirhodum]|uniref:programmed cell death protein 2-like n=1 Tax=Metopolophium dirhodum TaxID=44670 RepID=UPI0029900763|nr:programmed cell death protein 2-like [Metopolophium dirhodum]